MAAFLRRERAAAGALYDRFAGRIYGLGLVLLKNGTDAEDLVQDTFLKALRRGSAYDPRRGSLDTWMLLVARSLAIDLIRRRTLETRILASEAGRPDVSDEPGPEQYAVHRDLMERARAAMDRLPPKQRSAVELAYLGQRSSTQVARLEGAPRGTVKSRIRQGIISLRDAMSEAEVS
ncbi:MAG: sigma-70 family RNA polymerase sigma factor [Actinomycetota bacterium]